MRRYTIYRLGISSILILIILYFYSVRAPLQPETDQIIQNAPTTTTSKAQPTQTIQFKRSDIVVAVVACGDRENETFNMLKSALMFSKEKLNFIVLAETHLIEAFKEKLTEWKSFTNNGFTFKVMSLSFPEKDAEEWRSLFKPCAAQRLFLPNILNEVDSILYVDTDTIFLTPVETVWHHFAKMNASQMSALAPEHQDPNVGWYNRFAQHPFYPPLGVNSGVMLMNLTRMRAFQWAAYVVPIYKKYKYKITWGDQDIINIIFHYHPDKLLLYSCRYNYRPDHCMYMSVCKDAEREGVAVVHGSRGFFHSDKQPAFKAVYRAVEEFQLGGDLDREFYQVLEGYLEQDAGNCGKVKEAFLKNVRQYISIDYKE